MITDNFRIGIDWDGDGEINWGIAKTIPANLVPNPYFAYNSNIRGTTITGHEEPTNEPTLVKELSDQGVQHSLIACGGANSKQVWIGYRPRYYAQPLPGDILASSGCTLDNFNTQFTTAPYLVQSSRYGEYAYGATVFGRSLLNVFGGYPVVAATVYRFTFWHRLVGDGGGSVSSPSVQLDVFGNNVTSIVATSNVALVPGADWTKVSISFTPNAASTLEAIALTKTGTGTYTYQVAGMSLYPTASNPDYVADPAVVMDKTEFSALLEASTAYNYSFYVKADTFTKIGVIVNGVADGTATWTTLLAETQTTLVAGWQRVNVSFTTGAAAGFAMLRIIPYVGSNPASVSVTGNLYIKGVQITKGAALYPFHAGLTSGYDDVTSDTKRASWKSGKENLEVVMPYEGTLELTINNNLMDYSPANTASALYGYFNQNRVVKVQIKDRSTGLWYNLWTGWLAEFSAVAGRNQTREVKIMCHQGIQRFRQGELSVPVAQNVSFNDIILQIVEEGAWRSTNNAYEGVIDFNMQLDVNAYVADTNAMFSRIDTGINVYENVGMDWGRNTSTDEALRDLLTAENAGLWIDRDGLLSVVNRHFWLNRQLSPDVTLDANTEVQSADYVYGNDIINRYEVQFQPPGFDTNQIIWETKSPIFVKPGEQHYTAMVFKFPEGRVRTVQNVQSATSFSAYTVDPSQQTTALAVTDTVIVSNLISNVFQGAGNKYYLSITNNNSDGYWITATVRGDALDTGSEEAAVYEDLNSIILVQAVFKKNLSNPLIGTTPQALAVAQYFVSRNSLPIGNFSQIKVIDDGTQDTYDLIMSLKQGAVISVTEDQTAEASRMVGITEEMGVLEGGAFTHTVTLSKIDTHDYAQLDVRLGSDNAAQGAYPIGIRGASAANVIVDGVNLIELSTGKMDGVVYFIDNPQTVRQYDLSKYYNIAPSAVVSAPYASLSTYYKFGDVVSFTANENFLTWADYYISKFNPDIIVEANQYYALQAFGQLTHYDGTLAEASFPLIASNVKELDRVALVNGFRPVSELAFWNFNGANKQANYTPGVSTNLVNGFTDYSWGLEKRFKATVTATSLGVERISISIAQVTAANAAPLVNSVALIKQSNMNNMPLDSTKSYKLAIWLQTARNSQNVNYTFEALDGNHVVVGTTTGTPVRTGVTKLEVTVPSGTSFVTGRLRKTSGNSEFRNDRIWLSGIACTELSVSAVPSANALVYI